MNATVVLSIAKGNAQLSKVTSEKKFSVVQEAAHPYHGSHSGVRAQPPDQTLRIDCPISDSSSRVAGWSKSQASDAGKLSPRDTTDKDNFSCGPHVSQSHNSPLRHPINLNHSPTHTNSNYVTDLQLGKSLSKNDSQQDASSVKKSSKAASTEKKQNLTRGLGGANYMNEYFISSQHNMRKLQQRQLKATETPVHQITIAQSMPTMQQSHKVTNVAKKMKIPKKKAFHKLERTASKNHLKSSGVVVQGSRTEVQASGLMNAVSKDFVSGGGALPRFDAQMPKKLYHAGQLAFKMAEVDSLKSDSVQQQSEGLPQLTAEEAQAHQSRALQQERNLFYQVQDSTLVQENSVSQEMIEYLDDENPPSARMTGRTDHVRCNLMLGEESNVASHSVSADDPTDLDDGVPIVEDLEDTSKEIANTQANPVKESERQGGRQIFSKRETFIELRNLEDGIQLKLSQLDGQKTQVFDRSQTQQLFKEKKVDSHRPHGMSLRQNQATAEETQIYNARSGAPNSNFNFAKNSMSGPNTRPGSSHHGKGHKTFSKWTNTLSKGKNTMSSQQILSQHNSDQLRTTKSAHQDSTAQTSMNQAKPGVSGNSLQLHLAHSHYTKVVGNQSLVTKGSPSAKMVALAKSRGVHQNPGEIYKAEKSTTKHSSQPTNQIAVHENKNASSCQTSHAVDSISYIPPQRIRDQSLQLIHVPLSRAELNNQSAYHLPDQLQSDTASINQLSMTQTKDDLSRLRAPSSVTPKRHFEGAQQRSVFSSTASVKQVAKPQTQSKAQNGLQAHFDREVPIGIIFSRSQSNQHISETQSAFIKRSANSQSRGKQREQQQQYHTMFKQGEKQASVPNSGAAQPIKKIGGAASSKVSSSHQQTKIMRKNQNNLKMSRMQLREQDFKKITSHIQSQTVTNAKKKKFQLAVAQIINTSKDNCVAVNTPSLSNNQNRLVAKADSAIPEQEVGDRTRRAMQQQLNVTSQHRRSMQQATNYSMGTFLNPIDGGALPHQEGQVQSTRKFAYSLTDKYQGSFDELIQKQPGVLAASLNSICDGGASHIIPSENDHIVQAQTSVRKENAALDSGSKIKGARKLVSGSTSSHGGGAFPPSGQESQNQWASEWQELKLVAQSYKDFCPVIEILFTAQHQDLRGLVRQCAESKCSWYLQNRPNTTGELAWHPHGAKGFMEHFSKEKTAPGKIYKNQRQSWSNVLVSKLSKPASMINTNMFFSGSNASFFEGKKWSLERGALAQSAVFQQKVFHSRGSSKNVETQRLVKVNKPILACNLNGKPQQSSSIKVSPKDSHRKGQPVQQPPVTLAISKKKSGSFGGGYMEPLPVFSTNQNNADSFISSTHVAVNGGTVTAPRSQNSTQTQPHFLLDSNCQSPDQPQRKQQVLMNSQGNSALLAKICRSPKSSSKRDPKSNVDPHSDSKNYKPANRQSLTHFVRGLGQLRHEVLQGTKSPTKKATIKVSQKMQQVAQHSGMSTATKNVLRSDKLPAKNVSAKHTSHPPSATAEALQVLPQSSDIPLKQNIQILRQVNQKQITTASKGKDSGSVLMCNPGSKSLLVPSAESLEKSKRMLVESNAQPVHHSAFKPSISPHGIERLDAVAGEKERRLGSSLVISSANRSIVSGRPLMTPVDPSSTQQLKQSEIREQRQNKVMEADARAKGEVGGENREAQDGSQQKKTFIAQKYSVSQSQHPLNVIEERLESQDSAVSDLNLSPRSRHIRKLQRKIKLAFLKKGCPPETQTENYKIGKVMGKGAFGKVNLAIHRLSGKFVALKSINKQYLSQEQSKRKVMQEFNILRHTRHCNIVRLYESFETQQHIVFVMEVCGGGDLLTYVRRRRKLKENVSRFIFRQIITGLAYSHTKNVLHRDIKLDNILLTSRGDVKICDFGVSKLVTPGETLTEQCGTPAYIAPEVFRGEGYSGFKSDIWSAGVVLYAMLFGAVPFKASNLSELHRQVLEREPTYKEEEISADALSLLKGILEKDPALRLTSEQILEHKWMNLKKEKQVDVFSAQEKESIVAEFEYYNKKEREVVVEGENQILPSDPFAEQMLSSTQNSEIKNISTRSIILAPFNSTRSQLAYSKGESAQIQEMMAPRGSVKYSARVKEIDRQYELNNNADLDNGVYHQQDEEGEGIAEPNSGSNPPLPTEERPETRLRSRAHDEASIAGSFNQEHLNSQLDEFDERKLSLNSEEVHESSSRSKTKFESPRRTTFKNAPTSQAQQSPSQNRESKATHGSGKPMLSEWRMLEKRMVQPGSPPKQNLFDAKIFEEIKGDRALPDSADLGQDLEAFEESKRDSQYQSYEQVQIELYDDGVDAVGAESKWSKQQQATMVIDEAMVSEIERCGYPKPFILSSLNSDDLNHVTTFYYLLQTSKEY